MQERVHCIFIFRAHDLMFDICYVKEKALKILPYITVKFFPEKATNLHGEMAV